MPPPPSFLFLAWTSCNTGWLGETRSQYAAQDVLRLMILQMSPLTCWDYENTPHAQLVLFLDKVLLYSLGLESLLLQCPEC